MKNYSYVDKHFNNNRNNSLGLQPAGLQPALTPMNGKYKKLLKLN